MFSTILTILLLLLVFAGVSYWAWCQRQQSDQTPGRHRSQTEKTGHA